GSRGLDPRGLRMSADLRLEGATGQMDYGRAFLETIVSRGLGPVTASITAAAGTSEGELPAQRQFFLGGLQSVRGQTAGTAVGEAFWLGRVELGSNNVAVRPVLFGDFGWAGPRDGWSAIGRPMSGVGVGASFLDGMLRVDLARGLHPRWQTRLDLYLEARF
ncbi:MAG TPA: ShlB/FhaC/HecB family hemolysin secretion/activation protein, partial [Gemmatimonadaceae bacterium]|nr:ShlB/FhaC/HecB family hemolysin secretion/activation protein [Gemmatimonadaceae bacterium]